MNMNILKAKTSLALDHIAVALVENRKAIDVFNFMVPVLAYSHYHGTKARRKEWSQRSRLNKFKIKLGVALIGSIPDITYTFLRQRGELTLLQRELRKQNQETNNNA